MRFDTFLQSKQPIAFKVAQVYVNDEETKPFVTFQGVPGTGKTHLAVAIAYALLDQGETVIFKNVPELMDWLRDGFNPKRDHSDDGFFTARFADICDAPWLILDDCGAEHQTPWAQDKFYQIVNHRYTHCLPTVFTTNITLLDMDDRLRSRLSDRALCYAVPMLKEDYRSSEARGKEPTVRKRVTRANKPVKQGVA